MSEVDFAETLGPALAGALEQKGYTSLTPVQLAVLDPALAGRDLRITSQTGSGKTVAIGFVLREMAQEECAAKGGVGRPRALVVTPTRELAKQVEEELSWLYAPLRAKVVVVTGGTSYRDERRALSVGPAVVVGTPGRLLDHLTRGSIDPSGLGAVVLDEADRMLDLGFREELEAILGHAPEGHRTHLMSATFPREVRALADRVQDGAAHVEGTRLGVANVDIDHVVHLVARHERMNAIVNILLASPDVQTLVFARTRADVAEIANELRLAGFPATSLSGEMEQDARNRALAGFKKGALRVLVATDVAARGIDVQDIGRVIQAEPPTDADSYTHRSGRTGRAGRKGISALLVVPAGLAQATRILERAGVAFRFEPVPSAESIRAVADARLFEELTAPDPEDAPPPDPRNVALAARIAESGELATRTIARLLARVRTTGDAEPREVRPIAPPSRDKKRPSAERFPERPGTAAPTRAPREPHEQVRRGVFFNVSWGEAHGADARRLLAMMCRRGGIQGNQVGAIRVGRTASVVEIASTVAEAFAEAAGKPDPRDPRILITPDPSGGTEAPARGGPRDYQRARDPVASRARPWSEQPSNAPRTLVPPPKSEPESGASADSGPEIMRRTRPKAAYPKAGYPKAGYPKAGYPKAPYSKGKPKRAEPEPERSPAPRAGDAPPKRHRKA